MKKLFLMLFLVAQWCVAQDQGLSYFLSEARKSVATKDYANAYQMTMQASLLHPFHQGIMYQLGVLSALTDRPEYAVELLRKAILINAGFKLVDNPDLASLKERKDFLELIELQGQLLTPTIRSDTAFTLKDRTSHIESVTFDPVSGTFFLGSIHKRKIIAVSKSGEVKDFISSEQHGLTSVFGVKVNPKKRTLWACSSPMEEMENYDSTLTSLVSKFDSRTGKLLKQFRPTVKSRHVFGDLALNKKGEVFVSDSKNNLIFKVNEKTAELDLYYSSKEFWNLQGLSFSSDGQFLFISDYIKGPFRLDTKTMELKKISTTREVSLKGIDGLTYYEGDLIAIQNGTHPFRASRFILNQASDTIVDVEIIDWRHPAFNEPTIGTVVGKTFYYVANSQWGGYDDQHKPKAPEKLQDIVILKFELKD